MFNYDGNKGPEPKIGHHVKICHTNSNMDGLTGRIGGWGDHTEVIALVILDKKYRYSGASQEVEVVGIPVVCLKLSWPDKKHESHKSVRSSDASTFDFICDDCGATDDVTGGWGTLRKPCKGAV